MSAPAGREVSVELEVMRGAYSMRDDGFYVTLVVTGTVYDDGVVDQVCITGAKRWATWCKRELETEHDAYDLTDKERADAVEMLRDAALQVAS